MGNLLDGADPPNPNLFTPDFGLAPHSFVGRDDLLRDVRTGLGLGPADRRFTSLLLGPRGSGKTVTLSMIEDLAYQSGWMVLPLDATTPNFGERLEEYLAWARDEDESIGVAPSRLTTSSTKGLRAFGATWQRQVIRTVDPAWGLRRQLTTLADHAARHGSAVLLTIDELHSGDMEELRRLSSDLQHITKREQRPLAFVAAGLGEMRHTLLEDKRMTFFQRCMDYDMPPLTRVDAMSCLSKTVRDAGGKIEDSALRYLSGAAGPLPYRMQLLGYYAWTLADAPLSPIGESVVTNAIDAAHEEMHRRVFGPTWHTLNDSEQAFLRALAKAGGHATPREVGQRIDGYAPSTIARAHHRLVNFGCVAQDSRNLIAFGPVMGRSSVVRFDEMERQYAAGLSGDSASEGDGDADGTVRADRGKCSKYMPIAKARCILSRGHAGRCRST